MSRRYKAMHAAALHRYAAVFIADDAAIITLCCHMRRITCRYAGVRLRYAMRRCRHYAGDAATTPMLRRLYHIRRSHYCRLPPPLDFAIAAA